MSLLDFHKVHAAGNDFLLLCDLQPRLTPEQVRRLCCRKTGLGADGLIRYKLDPNAQDCTMEIFNCDGKQAQMCGNALRALSLELIQHASFPLNIHVGTKTYKSQYICTQSDSWGPIYEFSTIYPLPFIQKHFCSIQESLTQSIKELLAKQFDSYTQSMNFQLSLIHSGVDHLIIYFPHQISLDQLKINELSRPLRFHSQLVELFKNGANINWLCPANEQGKTWIRTYEKGVENETWACGTAAVASSYYLFQELENFEQEFEFITRHYRLRTSIFQNLEKWHVKLCGPAQSCYKTQVEFL